jgi:mono/diheme cytochrome c family protein
MRQTIVGVVVATLALAATVAAQHQHGDAKKTTAPPAGARRVTMDELHRQGGVPRGWKFSLPAGGDVAKGRQVFADLECFKCHVIKDASFPATGGDGNVGPDLTGMGGHHPAEYFAESILAPNAVLLEGPGWIGRDGRSIMPSYADALSVTQLVDLVAFLKSQDGGHAEHHAHGAVQERAVGPYRVRLVFHAADAHAAHGAHAGHGAAHAGHGAHTPKPAGAAGHLMAFVLDATTGEPVPYLPVSAGVHIQGAPARVVKLAPMLGGSGFHYGADTTLPQGTQRIVVTIGATTMQVMGADRGRYARPQTVAFDWSAPEK